MMRLPLYVRATILLLGLVLLLHSLVVAKLILIPFCWSLFIAVLLAPAVQWLVRHRIPLGWAITLVMVIATTLVVTILYVISFQIVELVSELPSITRKLEAGYRQVRSAIEMYLDIPYEEQPAQLISTLSNYLERGISTLGNTLTYTAKTVTMLGVMPVYVFFLLYYQHSFPVFVHKLYQHRQPDQVLNIVAKADQVVQGYLRGLLIVTLLVGCLAFLVFMSLGVKYALVFAIFVAVFNLIPYIGVFISSVVSIVYVFLTTDSLWYPLLTLALLWSIQILENNIITPYVVGNRIKLNPLVIILTVFAGAAIWGVSGMVLFIPLVGALKVLLDDTESGQAYGYLLGVKK
uniref:AI-2E family transporter n=1 Tax=Roseihalotalea indica TaxID=2867963 RepID=A0AA49GI45_9BACT|nr:AI-2E family transporter [Tunicatimonas sp. TK19036]